MRELCGVLPAEQLEFRTGLIHLDEFDSRLLRRSATFGQKNGAVFRAAEIAAKREFGVYNLAFPLLPGFGHMRTLASAQIEHHCTLSVAKMVLYRGTGPPL